MLHAFFACAGSHLQNIKSALPQLPSLYFLKGLKTSRTFRKESKYRRPLKVAVSMVPFLLSEIKSPLSLESASCIYCAAHSNASPDVDMLLSRPLFLAGGRQTKGLQGIFCNFAKHLPFQGGGWPRRFQRHSGLWNVFGSMLARPKLDAWIQSMILQRRELLESYLAHCLRCISSTNRVPWLSSCSFLPISEGKDEKRLRRSPSWGGVGRGTKVNHDEDVPSTSKHWSSTQWPELWPEVCQILVSEA